MFVTPVGLRQKHLKRERACSNCWFGGRVCHGREVLEAEARAAAHTDPLSRSREWCMLVFNSLGPFYSVQDPRHGLVPHI